MTLVTLTTDFGTRDPYVGVMKGVILSMAPKAKVVDITHDIEAHNIAEAAFVLRSIWPWYPEGTVHVAVVDPGVGSERRVLLGRYEGRYVIAPDNGLITLVHRSLRLEEMRVVENRRYLLPHTSGTFHGRDIMAPVAAHMVNGVKAME
ncbi:MAG: SAM-dependent chlorinase/fluorinase, partial [Phycisphaerales bacterium]